MLDTPPQARCAGKQHGERDRQLACPIPFVCLMQLNYRKMFMLGKVSDVEDRRYTRNLPHVLLTV